MPTKTFALHHLPHRGVLTTGWGYVCLYVCMYVCVACLWLCPRPHELEISGAFFWCQKRESGKICGACFGVQAAYSVHVYFDATLAFHVTSNAVANSYCLCLALAACAAGALAVELPLLLPPRWQPHARTHTRTHAHSRARRRVQTHTHARAHTRARTHTHTDLRIQVRRQAGARARACTQARARRLRPHNVSRAQTIVRAPVLPASGFSLAGPGQLS